MATDHVAHVPRTDWHNRFSAEKLAALEVKEAQRSRRPTRLAASGMRAGGHVLGRFEIT